MDRFSCFLLSNNWKRRKPSATCPYGKICLPLETISDRFICSQVWLNGPCFTEPAPFFSFQFFSPSSSVSSWLCTGPSLSMVVPQRSFLVYPSSSDHPIDIFVLLFASTVLHPHNNNNKTQIKTNKITSSSSMIFNLFLSPINKHFFFLFSIFTHVDVVFRSQTVHLFCYLEQGFFCRLR